MNNVVAILFSCILFFFSRTCMYCVFSDLGSIMSCKIYAWSHDQTSQPEYTEASHLTVRLQLATSSQMWVQSSGHSHPMQLTYSQCNYGGELWQTPLSTPCSLHLLPPSRIIMVVQVHVVEEWADVAADIDVTVPECLLNVNIGSNNRNKGRKRC